jgi:hypothetical protein
MVINVNQIQKRVSEAICMTSNSVACSPQANYTDRAAAAC